VPGRRFNRLLEGQPDLFGLERDQLPKLIVTESATVQHVREGLRELPANRLGAHRCQISLG